MGQAIRADKPGVPHTRGHHYLLIGGGAVGFVRGFVHEVISLFAWVVAVVMLKLFYPQLWHGMTGTVTNNPTAAAVIAFAILFVPSLIGVKLLARSIGGRTRRHAMLGPFDRVLGGGFGALKGLLADAFSLYLKTKNFHWHISGRHFRDYHLLLDEQSDQIYAMTDNKPFRLSSWPPAPKPARPGSLLQ